MSAPSLRVTIGGRELVIGPSDGLELETLSTADTRWRVDLPPPPGRAGWAEFFQGSPTRALGAPFRLSLGDLEVAGVVTAVEWGGPGEPLALRLSSAVDLDALSLPFPAPEAVVDGTTWPGAVELVGTSYPVPFGRFGYIATKYLALPAYLVDPDDAGEDVYLIADGVLEAVHNGGIVEAAVVLDGVVTPTVDLPVSTQVDSRGRLVTVARVTAGTYAPEAELWVASTPDPDRGPVGGIARELVEGAPEIRGAATIARWVLERASRIPLDTSRWLAAQQDLDAYQIAGAILEPVDAWEWVAAAIVPLLPVRPTWSRDGFYLQTVRYVADHSLVALDVIADDGRWSRTSVVRLAWDPVNDLTIRAGAHEGRVSFATGSYAVVDEDRALTLRLTGDPAAVTPGSTWVPGGNTSRSRTGSHTRARISREIYGDRRGEDIDAPFCWDLPTAFRVLRETLDALAMPPLAVSYQGSARAARAARVGSVVRVYDRAIGLVGALAVVEAVTHTTVAVELELSVLPGGATTLTPLAEPSAIVVGASEGELPAMTSVSINDAAVTTGDTLTAIWTTSGTPPITVAFQWVRAGVNIGGATSSTYVTQPADGGQVLQVRATPSNLVGTGPAVLSPPSTVYDPPVVVSVALSSYAALVGATLTATATVTGTFPITTSWRWLRNGVAIGGATASTYTLVSADVGTSITAEATGTGITAVSAPTTSPAATVSTRHAVRRTSGADVLRTAGTYALPGGSWSLVAVVEITATNGTAPFDILSWDFVSGGGGLLIAFTTATSPDRIRVQHTRAPATNVAGELVFTAGFPDITTIGRFKLLVSYDGTNLRARFAKAGALITSASLNSLGAINLGGGTLPIIEMAESVGALSWAMGAGVVTEAQLLAANEANWNMPRTLLSSLGFSLLAGRTFNDATVTNAANVEHDGSLLAADAGQLTSGSARLTAEE
jgi:hypothetical protein